MTQNDAGNFFDYIVLSLNASVHKWSPSTNVFTIQINGILF